MIVRFGCSIVTDSGKDVTVDTYLESLLDNIVGVRVRWGPIPADSAVSECDLTLHVCHMCICGNVIELPDKLMDYF